jgi:hypothetical protein
MFVKLGHVIPTYTLGFNGSRRGLRVKWTGDQRPHCQAGPYKRCDEVSDAWFAPSSIRAHQFSMRMIILFERSLGLLSSLPSKPEMQVDCKIEKRKKGGHSSVNLGRRHETGNRRNFSGHVLSFVLKS